MTQITRFRTSTTRGLSKRSTVDATGGQFSNGLITGFSMCSVGPALGHDLWCDQTFIDQLSQALASTERGIKSRFTHGNMSGDGIEDTLGRALPSEISANGKAIADLHVSKMSNPEKRRMVLTGAKEDPTSFGASIVFTRNKTEEDLFLLDHGATKDQKGRFDIAGFRSPDANNKENFVHTRLEKLYRVDIVGDPAANESGLFGTHDPIFSTAQGVVDFLYGQTEELPELTPFVSLGVPDEILDQLTPFLKRARESRATLKHQGAASPRGLLIKSENDSAIQSIIDRAQSILTKSKS